MHARWCGARRRPRRWTTSGRRERRRSSATSTPSRQPCRAAWPRPGRSDRRRRPRPARSTCTALCGLAGGQRRPARRRRSRRRAARSTAARSTGRGRSGGRGTARSGPRHRVLAGCAGWAGHSTSTGWCGWPTSRSPARPRRWRRLRAAGERVVFVTNNSSVPVAEDEAKLARHGIPAGGDVVTSAMAGGDLVEPGERVLVCGGPGVRRGARDAGRDARCDDGRRRRRGGRLPPRLRLRAPAVAADGRAPRGPAARHQRRRHLPDAGRARSPAAAPILAAVATAVGVRADGRRQAPRADGRRSSAPGSATDGIVVGDRPDTDGAFARAARLPLRPRAAPASRPRRDLPVDPAPDVVAADLAALVACARVR